MHDAALGTYRSLRRELEEAILPLAGSLDGRGFEFHAPIHDLQVALGGYVRIGAGDDARLGQITSLRLELVTGPVIDLALGHDAQVARTEIRYRAARGAGVLLEPSGPFTDGRTSRPRRRTCAPARRGAWRAAADRRAAARRASRSPSTPRASAATRSCAGSPGPARRTRSG